MICLDTNAVIAAINQREPRVHRQLERALVDRVVVGIPAIVLDEIWYGIKKSARARANATALHLAGLREHGVSYIFAGARKLDLNLALEVLNRKLGSRHLEVNGGGVTNGAFPLCRADRRNQPSHLPRG
jgi:predicted nucleic acid-binding protein